MTNRELRNLWFEFWKSKGHEIVESAPLVPINDDTLLWINAGVTPLKKYFDGSAVPNNKRMANIQKCIRTNDIENVGFTERHATFFEMMGNFSIGDYFKKESITWSWEFLTEYLKMDKEKLYVTIYPGDEVSHAAWRSIGLTDDRIIELENNFWEIGAGPSGPDSEIFYDRGEKYDPENIGLDLLIKEMENDRYIEIWNNVFSMYNADPSKDRSEYDELPSKNIDTGMGLERVLMVMQQTDSIFETDVLYPLIKEIEKISGIKYDAQVEFRAIADHIRTVTFSLSDGANFGNTGRDYVLRRLLRRAVRFGKKIGIEKPFMYNLVETVVNTMGDFYPNLITKKELVALKVMEEEKLFNLTLANGEKKFKELVENSDDKTITGADAFKLYDTYGFPFDLTKEMAEDIGFSVSKEEFENHMEKQKDLARNARNVNESMNMQNEHLINFKEESKFVGYDVLENETKIIAIFDGEKFVANSKEGYLVLEETPFYVESGGQVSDIGFIIVNNNEIKIELSFKGPNKQHFHYFEADEELKVGDKVEAKVNEQFRNRVTANHSAAHLLQNALKKILGSEIEQAGSRVDDKTFRFDFIYDGKISNEQIIEIEKEVNKKIQMSNESTIQKMPIEDALEQGATAIFEDKYDKIVRVVKIGESNELCGGTHVDNSAFIEKFAIVDFQTKGNNTYRIEATTRDNIPREVYNFSETLNDSIEKQTTKINRILEEANENNIELNYNEKLFNEKMDSYAAILELSKHLAYLKEQTMNIEKEYKQKLIQKKLEDLSEYENQIIEKNNKKYLFVKTENETSEVIKEIIQNIANKHSDIFIFWTNASNQNINFFARSNTDISAGEIIKKAAELIDGKGGGSPTFAQGGGTNTSSIDEIIETIKEIVF